jgi:hypothetical protein
MAARAELVAHSTEWLQKRLSVLGRFEALQDPLTLAHRQVRIVRSVVQSFVAPMLSPREHPLDGRHITRQFVRDNYSWLTTSCCEHAPQEGDGRLFVASFLDEDVQHEPILIYRSPQPVLPPADLQLHLVDVPFVGPSRPSPTKLLGVGRAELAAPEADRFITDLDAALAQQLLNVAMAQIEPVVQPDGVADDLGGKR